METDKSTLSVPESVTLGELDLALVNALQLRPRATWAELADPLGTTPGTLARRWDRLSRAGLAWVTAAPGKGFTQNRCTAFVLVQSQPNYRTEVVVALAGYAEVVTIQTASGTKDIILDVLTHDLRTLDRFLSDELNRIPGITATSVFLATSMYLESSRWRLRSLDPGQLTAINPSPSSLSPANPAISLAELDRQLLDHLVRDGRRSWMELAQETGSSTATVRRRVNKLVASGIVTFRCEIANSFAGWPIQASLLAQAPAKDLDSICRALAGWPESRLVAAVTGPANVYLTLWAQNLGEVQRLESVISSKMPSLAVVDRTITLNMPKRMGHLCDSEGRRVGVQPISPW